MTYKNPPANNQWQKGKSGNPAGRPPDKHIREVIKDMLQSEAIDKQGNKLSISNLDVAVRTLLTHGVKGNVRALELLLNYAYGKPSQPASVEVNKTIDLKNEPIDEADKKILAELMVNKL